MSPVIHVSKKAHAMAKNYCAEHDLQMSRWISELISQAIERSLPKHEAVTQGKKLVSFDEEKYEDIMSAPPFWVQKSEQSTK